MQEWHGSQGGHGLVRQAAVIYSCAVFQHTKGRHCPALLVQLHTVTSCSDLPGILQSTPVAGCRLISRQHLKNQYEIVVRLFSVLRTSSEASLCSQSFWLRLAHAYHAVLPCAEPGHQEVLSLRLWYAGYRKSGGGREIPRFTGNGFPSRADR